MKINQSPLDAANVSQSGRTHEVAGIGPGAEKRALARADRDRVQVSDLSARLLAQEDTGGPARDARVQQLSADVRAGRYQVNALELSSRLVDESIRL
jgi:flagellar biosynthesis anti-sigma factor FlgM